ncbi:ATP-binding protein [Pseudomonas sp. xss_1]|uniref:ATP-binding protein n=1 Tax=Pseudomonas sp. xss_1 TaxID=3367214 RepID=UPI00370C8185
MNILRTVISDNPLSRLVGDVNQSFVGYVYNLRYDECFVQTNDAFKHAVNGLPHNSFILAAGFDPSRFDVATEIDREVILLRVLGPAPLPQDGDMVRTRIEHHQRRRETERLPGDINDGLDPMTASELQWGGMRCRVLGTFYMDNGQLRFGSDIENFMSLSRMRAYKPRGSALELIVNHVNPEVRAKAHEEAIKAGFTDTPQSISIGTIRYTSTARLHRGAGEQLVKVEIQPADFLARRTAVLGMTRTGKSNTVKTTVSAVALAAMKSDIRIGQLIFDVNGEYANANHQDDGSSIAEVFGDRVVRYRAIETPNFQDLRANFYQEPNQGLNLIQALYDKGTSPYGGQDLDTFMGTTLEEPEASERSEHTRWQRHVAVFQCILHRANYPAPAQFKVKVPRGKDLLRQMKSFADSNEIELNIPSDDYVTLPVACAWFEQIRTINLGMKENQNEAKQPTIGLSSSTPGNSWVDPALESMLNILVRETSRKQQFAGWRAIRGYLPYHSARRNGDVATEILGHLDIGKIVILDLSAGPVEIRDVLSERIARQIFQRQMNKLNAGEVPQNVVLYVEEAHNLIGNKTELTTTWPRIAKEGAKAKIAFVYATQEPSSVHPNILANTENWFVTHLNNDDELKTLGKFYDFGDFLASLKTAQDVGFARIKTLSAPFVIPTQINRFTPEAIKLEMQSIGIHQASLPGAGE